MSEERNNVQRESQQAESEGGGISISAGRDATFGAGVVVVGRDAYGVQTSVTKTQDPNTDQLEAMFQELYQKIDASSSPVKDSARGIVQQIEKEVTRPEDQPDESKVESWLKGIEAMAPDIFDVIITTFANPPAGVAMVIKKIGERIKAEAG